MAQWVKVKDWFLKLVPWPPLSTGTQGNNFKKVTKRCWRDGSAVKSAIALPEDLSSDPTSLPSTHIWWLTANSSSFRGSNINLAPTLVWSVPTREDTDWGREDWRRQMPSHSTLHCSVWSSAHPCDMWIQGLVCIALSHFGLSQTEWNRSSQVTVLLLVFW